MDRLTFALVALAVVLLAVLPLVQLQRSAPPPRAEAEPSLRAALEEDLRTGKITPAEYAQAEREGEV